MTSPRPHIKGLHKSTRPKLSATHYLNSMYSTREHTTTLHHHCLHTRGPQSTENTAQLSTTTACTQRAPVYREHATTLHHHCLHTEGPSLQRTRHNSPPPLFAHMGPQSTENTPQLSTTTACTQRAPVYRELLLVITCALHSPKKAPKPLGLRTSAVNNTQKQ